MKPDLPAIRKRLAEATEGPCDDSRLFYLRSELGKGNTPRVVRIEAARALERVKRERDEALARVAELEEEVDGLNRVLGCFARTAKSVTCSHLHDEHPARLFAESVIEEWEVRSAE